MSAKAPWGAIMFAPKPARQGVEVWVDAFDLSFISENDQLTTELTRRAEMIGQFYQAMVDSGLPADLAGTIVVEWARAGIHSSAEPSCGCDCDVCRGETAG